MIDDTVKKKRRSDRNHLIYKLTNVKTNESYVGITVVSGRAIKKSLDERWKRHVSRAKLQNHEWNLCNSIREHGDSAFTREVLMIVRGKAVAHKEERRLIKEHSSSLNTF